MICYSLSLCLGQVFMTKFGDAFAVRSRMKLSIIGTTLVCLALATIPVAAKLLGSAGANILALIMTLALGLMNALMQTTVLGVAGMLGPDISVAAMFGFGVSGLVSLALALLVQFLGGIFHLSEGDGTTGGVICVTSFLFCTFFTLFSAWTFHGWLARRVPEAVSVLQVLEARRLGLGAQRPAARQEPGMPMQTPLAMERGGASDNNIGGLSVEAEVARKQIKGRTRQVLREVAPQAFNVALVFITTMTVFPGVVTNWVPGPHSVFVKDVNIFGTLLVGCFQIFDTVGRKLASCTKSCLPAGRLWILVVLRLAFIPTFILGQRKPDSFFLWGSDAGRMFLVAALATTNGLCASCAMMFGPERSSSDLREVAGIAMSCTMVCGIFCGTLLAFLTQL